MCRVKPVEKLEAVPVMLAGEALRFYYDKSVEFRTFIDSKELLM